MKDLIAGCIHKIIREKTEKNILPNEATEFELKLGIMEIVERQLEEMINDGIVIVTGRTINKVKLLKV